MGEFLRTARGFANASARVTRTLYTACIPGHDTRREVLMYTFAENIEVPFELGDGGDGSVPLDRYLRKRRLLFLALHQRTSQRTKAVAKKLRQRKFLARANPSYILVPGIPQYLKKQY